MKLTSMKIQVLCIFGLILVVGTSASSNCPFDYLYHFGDTTTDIGNAVLIKPWGPDLPAANPPYGQTTPGYPTGRWSDGLIDFDYTSQYYGLPNIVPYLGMNGSTDYDGVMFSVAKSPVLDRWFFESRGIEIPPYAVSLNGQFNWFKKYLKSVCSTPEACAERLQQSLLFTGDLEGNDLVYGLTQGKSYEEVRTYVPYVIEAQINLIRELIGMGVTRVLLPGNIPMGCSPYILTELGTDNPDDYDDIGCLATLNNLFLSKNNDLQEAIANINQEFPDVGVFYVDNYGAVYNYIRNLSDTGPYALRACCGVGGKHNYDSKRFCGSPEATVCPNPEDYIWWDGMHSTQESYSTLVAQLIDGALLSLNCTIPAPAQLSASM